MLSEDQRVGKTRGKFPFGFIRPARANTEADNNLKANTHLWRMKDFGSERLLSFISNFRLIDAERGLIEYGLLLRLGSISKTRKKSEWKERDENRLLSVSEWMVLGKGKLNGNTPKSKDGDCTQYWQND